MPRERGRKDFFISFASPDQEWAEWISWQLEQAGYSVVFQTWDFPPGGNIPLSMDSAMQDTERTIAVLSPAYLKSRFARPEWAEKMHIDPTGDQRRLVPIRVEDCTPRGLLGTINSIDLVGLDEDATRRRLLAGIEALQRGRARPSTAPPFPEPAPSAGERQHSAQTERPRRFPRDLPQVWNVPEGLHNPSFTGRHVQLGALDAQRRQAAEVDTPQAITPQAITGEAGVGKTALAVEYAYRYRGEFDIVWWVHAGQTATLLADYRELAGKVGLHVAGMAGSSVIWAVRHWLQGQKRWLLILDNAADPDMPTGQETPLATLSHLLPSEVREGHGQVLVTTRDAGKWTNKAQLIELDKLTPEEAARFLRKRTESNDVASSIAIAKRVGGLPSDLEREATDVVGRGLPLAERIDERIAERIAERIKEPPPWWRQPKFVIPTVVLALAASFVAGWLANDEPRSLAEWVRESKSLSLEGVSIKIGSKQFAEQQLLGYIAKLTLEAAGATVNSDHVGELSTTRARKLLENDQLDAYFEYTGTAWIVHLDEENLFGESEEDERSWELFNSVRRRDWNPDDPDDSIAWFALGEANTTYTIVAKEATLEAMEATLEAVRGQNDDDTATISDYADLVNHHRDPSNSNGDPDAVRLCVTLEFPGRADGIKAVGEQEPGPLEEKYDFELANDQIEVLPADEVPQAVGNDDCPFGVTFHNAKGIKEYGLTELEDDLEFFPPYNLAMSMRTTTYKPHSATYVTLFNLITELLDDEKMQELNAAVVATDDPEAVARDFLQDEGIIPA